MIFLRSFLKSKLKSSITNLLFSDWFKNLEEYKDYEWDQEGLPLKDAKKQDVSKVI